MRRKEDLHRYPTPPTALLVRRWPVFTWCSGTQVGGVDARPSASLGANIVIAPKTRRFYFFLYFFFLPVFLILLLVRIGRAALVCVVHSPGSILAALCGSVVIDATVDVAVLGGHRWSDHRSRGNRRGLDSFDFLLRGASLAYGLHCEGDTIAIEW